MKMHKDDVFKVTYQERFWLQYSNLESCENVVAIGIRIRCLFKNNFTPFCAFLVVAVQLGAFNNYIWTGRGGRGSVESPRGSHDKG